MTSKKDHQDYLKTIVLAAVGAAVSEFFSYCFFEVGLEEGF